MSGRYCSGTGGQAGGGRPAASWLDVWTSSRAPRLRSSRLRLGPQCCWMKTHPVSPPRFLVWVLLPTTEGHCRPKQLCVQRVPSVTSSSLRWVAPSWLLAADVSCLPPPADEDDDAPSGLWLPLRTLEGPSLPEPEPLDRRGTIPAPTSSPSLPASPASPASVPPAAVFPGALGPSPPHTAPPPTPREACGGGL